MSEKYLLPCECGKSVAVERPQAGTQVACVCGRQLEVPTIRGFAKLERAESKAEKLPPIWGLKQGLIFLGLLIAIPAFAYATYLYPKKQVLTEALLSHATQNFDQITPMQAHMLWKHYSEGIPRNPTIDTQAVLRGIETLGTHIKVGGVIGILGLLIAASGLFVKRTTAGKA